MIVPEFWAEAKTKKYINRRQVTMKRFGWSDVSQLEAQDHAQARVDEAFEAFMSNPELRRRERKVAYNGADGLPIREEIIARHQDAVITRNSYGALCINTPDVLFADIDFDSEPSFKFSFVMFAALALCAALIGLYFSSVLAFFVLLFVAAVSASSVAGIIQKFTVNAHGGPEKIAKDAVVAYAANHPEAHLRLYRTPMGYRVLAMHKTFDPRGDAALELLEALHSDPLYVRMCQNQNCFRARVSPKPWRIGLGHIRPKPGVWPINPDRMPDRLKWVAAYEKIEWEYASCRFEEKIGSDQVHPKAEFVRAVHDLQAKSDSALPLA